MYLDCKSIPIRRRNRISGLEIRWPVAAAIVPAARVLRPPTALYVWNTITPCYIIRANTRGYKGWRFQSYYLTRLFKLYRPNREDFTGSYGSSAASYYHPSSTRSPLKKPPLYKKKVRTYASIYFHIILYDNFKYIYFPSRSFLYWIVEKKREGTCVSQF